MNSADTDKNTLQYAMTLSLVVGVLMLVMKVGAYWITGSAAILSDAAESVVHVAAVGFAAYSLNLSYRPPDSSHPYGHAKISFFSAGFEGAMIVFAALYIIYEAITKWLQGLYLENLGWGTVLTALAMIINAALGGYLLWLGKKNKSIILEANGKHVLTDSWTSLGVLVGLGLTLVTGWLSWDPIFALLVASNILVSGIGLMRRSIGGLMDQADPQIQQKIVEILAQKTAEHQIRFHALKHRNLGNTYWVDVHLLFPGETPVQSAHQIATEIERAIEQALEPAAYVITHLESIEDHRQAHQNTRHEL